MKTITFREAAEFFQSYEYCFADGELVELLAGIDEENMPFIVLVSGPPHVQFAAFDPAQNPELVVCDDGRFLLRVDECGVKYSIAVDPFKEHCYTR